MTHPCPYRTALPQIDGECLRCAAERIEREEAEWEAEQQEEERRAAA